MLWWQVAWGTEPGVACGATPLVPAQAAVRGPGTARRCRGAGAAAAAPRGAPARAALTQAPQTCWGRQAGVWGTQALPCPCLTWHPGFTRVSPALDPPCRPPGQLLAWGWAPGLLGMLVSHSVGINALFWYGKGARGLMCWGSAATLGPPKGTPWALGLCAVAVTICTSSWLRLVLALQCVCQGGQVGTGLRGTEHPVLHPGSQTSPAP